MPCLFLIVGNTLAASNERKSCHLPNYEEPLLCVTVGTAPTLHRHPVRNFRCRWQSPPLSANRPRPIRCSCWRVAPDRPAATWCTCSTPHSPAFAPRETSCSSTSEAREDQGNCRVKNS